MTDKATPATTPDVPEVFTFEREGKTYSIPAFAKIPMGVLRKARKSVDDIDKTFIILETMIGEDHEAFIALDKMEAAEFGEFIQKWTQRAGLGEA